MSQMILRKSGNLVDLSPDGVAPTPRHLVEALIPDMSYLHKQTLHGADQYDAATGERRYVKIEARRLYGIVEGRLTCGAGYIPRIARKLAGLGIECRLVDLTPPSPRPGAYEPNWDNVRRFVQFRARQEECLRTMSTQPGGVIHAVTGFGKTTLCAALGLLYPKARIDIVIKSVDVVERCVRGLTRYLPDIGQIGGGERCRRRINVITADSMHHADGDADFLIADEAHQLLAESYATQIGQTYRNSRNFALSATPYCRLDGAHARMEPMFGPTIFELLYPEAVQLGLVVPIRVRWLPIILSSNPAQNKTGIPKKRHGIWRNQARNQIVADAARSYPEDQQVLVLVETVEHAVYLWQMLPEFALCYGTMKPTDQVTYTNQGLLPGNFMQPDAGRRQQLRAEFERGTLKRVIATDVWATGVDFEQLAVVVRADGRDSEIMDTQGPGRASRIYTAPDGTAKPYGELCDCIDNFDKGLQTKSRSRFQTYKSLGWEQDWPTGRRQLTSALGGT